MIQQFQPEGHICSLSFAVRIRPNLPFSIYLLRMHSAVSAAPAPSTRLPPTLHKYQISTDYIPLLTFKYDSWSRVLLLAGKMSCSPPAVNSRALNCSILEATLMSQTVPTFHFFFMCLQNLAHLGKE